MMRLIDVDELWTDITREIEDCSDVLEIIERQTIIVTPEKQICSVTVDTDEIIERIKERGWGPVKHGRWILCNERLPEIGDTYIVTGIQKDPHEKDWHYFVDVASNYGDYIDDYWDTFNDWIEGQETHIVAWMPLPEPYKMDGDED